MHLKNSFQKKELTDSGLAFLLLTLLSGIWFPVNVVLKIAIAETLILLMAPVLFWPFAFLWLNFSDLLGWVMSKVILTVVFIFVVCPVGLFRKVMGKDALLLTKFKKSDRSVFSDRTERPGVDFSNQY